METTVAIFSFNRGSYLSNACASARRHWPAARILIMDDHSDDRKTLKVLNEERLLGAEVVRPGKPATERKRGGLYENMQTVWEQHLRTPYALYMQDDQQIVRSIGARDEAAFQKHFRAPNSPPFLHVVFPRNVIWAPEDEIPLTDEKLEDIRSTFSPTTLTFDPPEMDGLSDTGLWDVERAKAVGWTFAEDEAANKARGRALFGPGRITAAPFLAHLPTPFSFRNRRVTLTRRLYFALTSDVDPVNDLTDAQNERLLTEVGEPPLGDWYLRSSRFGRSAPWHHVPMSGAPGWLVKLDVREQALRAHIASVRDSVRRRLSRAARAKP